MVVVVVGDGGGGGGGGVNLYRDKSPREHLSLHSQLVNFACPDNRPKTAAITGRSMYHGCKNELRTCSFWLALFNAELVVSGQIG